MRGASILSYDQYHHVGTVTGATWTSQGRTFDGVDNKITVADHTALDIGTNDFSIFVAGVKLQENGFNTQVFADKRNSSSPFTGWAFYYDDADNKFHFQANDGVVNNIASDAIGDIEDNVSRSFGVTVDRDNASGLVFYIDGVVSGAAKDPSARQGSLANSVPLVIGKIANAGEFLEGSIGEIWVWTGVKSADEILYNHNKTRGRYS